MITALFNSSFERSSPRPENWRLSLWAWLVRHSRREPKSLRLCESLPLGDRRFVAVVEYQQARFLLGGTSNSLVMLARLECGPESSPRPEMLAPDVTASTQTAQEQPR